MIVLYARNKIDTLLGNELEQNLRSSAGWTVHCRNNGKVDVVVLSGSGVVKGSGFTRSQVKIFSP